MEKRKTGEKKKSKKNIKLLVRRIIVIVLLLLILFLAFFGLSKLLKLIFAKEVEAGNLSNMGLATLNKKTVYYNKYEDGIFAVKGNKETRITEETAYSMTVSNDTIYYLTNSDTNAMDLKSVKTNGEDLKTIKTLQTSLSKFYFDSGSIYYFENSENPGIAKFDLESEHISLLVEQRIQDFVFDNNIIYYTNEQGVLYSFNLKTSENKELTNEYSIQKIQVLNKWIYFYDEGQNALCKIKIDGTKEKVVSTFVNNELYNVTSKKIYYFDSVNKQICASDLKGKKSKAIVSVTATKPRINIANKTIYYLDTSKSENQMYQMYRVKTNGSAAKPIEY